MKTIYNLQVGDSYWSKTQTAWGEWEACETGIRDSDNLEFYENDVKYGYAFLTKEECQRSIDYDVALAKINKRASGLGEDLKQKIEWSEDKEELVTTKEFSIHAFSCGYDKVQVQSYCACTYDTDFFGELLNFEKEENAKIIAEELPEECKTVLGVD